MKRKFAAIAILFLAPMLAHASFEGVWVGSGGLLKNSRGWQSPCESARLDVIGEIGTYRVTFEASCGGIPYREKFFDVRDNSGQLFLRDPWGFISITNLGGKVHASGKWFNINWPNTMGTVDADLEIDLTR